MSKSSKSENLFKQAVSWRDVLPIHPAAELFPMISAEELRELGEDIKERGPQTSITIFKAQQHSPFQLLDGRNRLDAMELVGFAVEVENVGSDADPAIRLWMRQSSKHVRMRIEIKVVRGDGLGGDPYAYVFSANIHRRHLTPDQKRELIAKLLKTMPNKSDRQIAKTVKASPTTVGTVRTEMEATGEVSKLDTRTDKRGVKQPARKPAPPKGPAVMAGVERAVASSEANRRQQAAGNAVDPVASAEVRKAEAAADSRLDARHAAEDQRNAKTLLQLLDEAVAAADRRDNWPSLPPAALQRATNLIARIRAEVADLRQILERACSSAAEAPEPLLVTPPATPATPPLTRAALAAVELSDIPPFLDRRTRAAAPTEPTNPTAKH